MNIALIIISFLIVTNIFTLLAFVGLSSQWDVLKNQNDRLMEIIKGIKNINE